MLSAGGPGHPGLGIGGVKDQDLPSSLLCLGLIFINTPGILVVLGVWGMPAKEMDLAVIPVIGLRRTTTRIIQFDKYILFLLTCLLFIA
jgi:hypothetical protein